MDARRARLALSYNNVDITADLQRYLKGWTYTDNMSGQADDLQIVLEDKQQLWTGPWFPEKGATLKAEIVRLNWGLLLGWEDRLPLGTFEIDEIEVSSAPSEVTVKSISVPESTPLRGEARNRAWEKTKLSVVVRDIAAGAGLKLFYDTADDPEYDRVEQTEESDLGFLMRLCNDAGLALKVSDAQVVIFDEQKYEQQDPITTITKGEAYIKSYRGRTTLNGMYKACRVEYHDANKNRTIKYTFTPPDPPKTGRVLVINERVSSLKEAERLAKKRLRQENKNGVTFSVTLLGDTWFLAGLTVNLAGFGVFDGKYVITQAVHGQQDGYETKLELRKCLEGY